MKVRKRIIFPVLLALGLVAGPRPDYPVFDGTLPEISMSMAKLDEYVREKDRSKELLKPDNESRIIWADSLQKTPYSIVYLHGWSASPEEGDPIHEEFAARYGCNLYLPLLAGHGLDTKESFLDITPKDLVESAKEAIAIGQLLGEKVIVMSCSTGSTLSAYLAAENQDAIYAQMMYSPNIDIYDPMSELLTMPWGKQLAGMIVGKYHSFNPPPEGYKYWTTTYRMEGLICLKSLVESTMKPSIWAKLKQPLFMGYYYKNEEEQDHTVSVAAMHEFFGGVSTPDDQKREMAFPGAGHHVVISRILSKDLETVRESSFAFAEEVLGMVPELESGK